MPRPSDDPWLERIPQLHRILAGSEPPSAHPALPQGDDVFEYCAYWEPLYYLLLTIPGWGDPGKGLAWWYTHSRPGVNAPVTNSRPCTSRRTVKCWRFSTKPRVLAPC